MMDVETWKRLAEQVPGLVALILLVGYFLRTNKEIADNTIKEFERLRNECHDFHGDLHKSKIVAIDRNSKALEANTKILSTATYILDKHYTSNGGNRG